MSRSYKFSARQGWSTAKSDAWAKRKARKLHRRHLNVLVSTWDGETDISLPCLRELTECWDFPKDGKRYHGVRWILQEPDLKQALIQWHRFFGK